MADAAVMRRQALVALVAVVASGCAGGSATSGSSLPGPTLTAPATTAIQVSASAGQLVAALAAKIPTAQPSITYKAATDPNNLLGRPGGYTSKSTFTDSRINPVKAQTTDLGSVDLGGSIEVYPDNAGALKRGQSIQSIIGAAGVFAHEYDFTSGGALLRLAAGFTPDQATAYANALANVTGREATAVS